METKVQNQSKEELSRMLTDAGREVVLQPVSHVLLSEIRVSTANRMREAGKPIDPPTYESKLLSGNVEINEYDADSLEYPLEWALAEVEDGDEEKAKKLAAQKTAEAVRRWNAHLKAVEELEIEVNTKERNFLFQAGVQSWDGGRVVPQEWAKMLELSGFTIPTDPIELEYYYVIRGLLLTALDQVEATRRIMALTARGVNNEMVQGALDFFRLQVDGQGSHPETTEGEGGAVLVDELQGSGS